MEVNPVIHEQRYHAELPIEDGMIAHSRNQFFNGLYYPCCHEIWQASGGYHAMSCPECDGTGRP